MLAEYEVSGAGLLRKLALWFIHGQITMTTIISVKSDMPGLPKEGNAGT
jgi:hypothetical protein